MSDEKIDWKYKELKTRLNIQEEWLLGLCEFLGYYPMPCREDSDDSVDKITALQVRLEALEQVLKEQLKFHNTWIDKALLGEDEYLLSPQQIEHLKEKKRFNQGSLQKLGVTHDEVGIEDALVQAMEQGRKEAYKEVAEKLESFDSVITEQCNNVLDAVQSLIIIRDTFRRLFRKELEGKE